MTGNTTQLGIDIANLLKDNNAANRASFLKSASIVIGFVIGAFLGAILYVYFDFWSVAPFILPILYFSYLASQQKFNQAWFDKITKKPELKWVQAFFVI